MTNHGQYDVISRFYDDAVGCRDGRAEYVRRILNERHPSARTLLELGCGTGLVLEYLENHYLTYGLDASPGMLECARRRLKTAGLHLADMSNFQLGEKFDAIICIYDSINHLHTFSAWEQTFARVNEHLEKDGIFLFDINTQYKLNQLATHSSSWPKFDEDYDALISRRFGPNHMLLQVTKEEWEDTRWDVSFYEHLSDNDFRLWRDSFHEVSFPVEAILRSLNSSFSVAEV